MIELFLIALWVFMPAGIANMAPVLAKKVPGLNFLNKPIDGGASFRKKRIFGDHKTVRGFVAGFVLAWLAVLLQRVVWKNVALPCLQCGMDNHYAMQLTTVNSLLLAFLYSFGALGGDAIESFFKRQFNKPSGSRWFPFDQLDYIVGGLLATYPVGLYSRDLMIMIVVIFFGLHILSTFIGYHLGLKDEAI